MLLAARAGVPKLLRMCPACLASLGLLVAGATGAGGLTALVVDALRPKKNRRTPKGSNAG